MTHIRLWFVGFLPSAAKSKSLSQFIPRNAYASLDATHSHSESIEIPISHDPLHLRTVPSESS